MIVTENEHGVLWKWMHDRINIPWSSDFKVIGMQRKDLSIGGAVAYTSWLEESVFMHVCLEGHAYRDLLREAFMYPFDTCSKKRVYGMTPITSGQALALSKNLGFREVSRTPDFVLQVMTREECRWINDDIRSSGRTAEEHHPTSLGRYWRLSGRAAVRGDSADSAERASE